MGLERALSVRDDLVEAQSPKDLSVETDNVLRLEVDGLFSCLPQPLTSKAMAGSTGQVWQLNWLRSSSSFSW